MSSEGVSQTPRCLSSAPHAAMSMDAFASLIADSIAVTHTQQTDEQRAVQVARSVQQLRTTLHRAKGAQQQTARIAAAEQQQAQRQKRIPAWSIDDSAAAALKPTWTADDLAQLQSLMREEGLCGCATVTRRKKRKLASASDASLSVCCCFDRLLRVSQRMQRAVGDIQRKLTHSTMPLTSATPTAATASLAAAAVPAPSADSIAAAWAAHSAGDDRASFLPSATDWLMGSGPVIAVSAAAAPAGTPSPAIAAAAPAWSEAQVHRLIEIVRDQRAVVLERHTAAQRRQREAKAAAAAAHGDEVEEDHELKEEEEDAEHDDTTPDLVDLSPSDWSTVAAALSTSPSLIYHPSTVRDRYFAAVDRGGLAVPSAAASHPAFYFPSQAALDKLARFQSALHPAPRPSRREDEDEEASEEEANPAEEEDDLSALREEAKNGQEEEDDGGASTAGARSAAASASRVDSVLRAVRRLSKRYRA